ncbi:single-stranded-DNA-specific exonuclease RecJ [Salipaludibacillus neizhouensis]|uniref:Single-stranded-DNA-specific exonuclease RecJ n=1 Tax=Salipaludibacillus neizhouensis TaxID=885475 RepID=A0A3A9KCT8_9BACI|nr:single-stranded-DNA-specific exonuclease RecJ [Salipaludibacillus neizhouensis]RKL68570.1 single-stranded-DNA-specific exonuclease RecJ [Salipaludibacillus neizhouensis]
MLHSKANWKIKDIDEQQVAQFSEQIGLSMIATRFLVQRGMTTKDEVDAFLHMNNEAIHDPYLLKDMKKAIDRIRQAIDSQERILVFGDYDADGVTSTSLMYMTLIQLGANVGFYVPNRFTEGYGPNEQAFRHAAEEEVTLIITVDTGISAVHEAEVAKELNIDLIITDHHEPPPVIPDGFAVVNPKRSDCSYPNENLAGVGVAFKVAHALLERIPEEYFDLVAIGTIADLVALKGENRYLAMKGIHSLSSSLRPGLKALLERAGANPQEMSEEQVGFIIGPRLNAAGRLDSADPAIQLLISEDPMEAEELAEMIDDLNKERQQIVKEIALEAEQQVEAYEDGVPPVIIVGQAGWNAGVIGIVASRLVEKYYRPTIVLSYDEEKGLAKGSARSIEGFDMFQSLSQCRDWLPHFGGHPMAAGLTMQMEDIDRLKTKLSQIALDTVADSDWQKSISVDLPISLKEVSVNAIYDLQQMAPFGIGNPAPKVMLSDVHMSMIKKIGASEDHLKVTFQDEDQKTLLDGIGFRMGALHDSISPLSKISTVGKLSINEWNGSIKPQFMIEDVKITEWQMFDFRGDKRVWQNKNLFGLEECTVVMFQEETLKYEKNIPDNWKVVQLTAADPETTELSRAKNILLLDLPSTLNQMKQCLNGLESLENLYTLFIHEGNHFFETIPSREQFKWLYAFLMKRKQFDLKKNGQELAKYKGWNEKAVKFMCQVFFELEFVKISNGIVEVEAEPKKKDLTESFTYQKYLEQSDIENELYYSSYRALKQWIDRTLADKHLASV